MDFLQHGILDLSLTGYLVYTLVLLHTTIIAVTLYLHRDQTHRGLTLHPAVRHFFRFWLWLTTAIETKEWVAVHRKHHARCETEDDPHSPQIVGLKKVLFEGAELYKEAAADEAMVEKYGRGTPDDWIERNLYVRHIMLGVSIMLLIDVALLGVPGIIVFAAQGIVIPVLAAGIVNGVGHYGGYRNFECDDASRNVMPIGVIMGGEELHNNHHAFPSSAKFTARRWEFDIGWFYICILEKLGLARVNRLAPRPVLSDRSKVDLDTVRAVIVNRMHVLREYADRVTVPVLNREMNGDGALRRARKLLISSPRLLDESARRHLSELLSRHQRLRTVHEFRERLAKLWSSSHLSNERLLALFREWCAQAEASGIRALQEFASALKSYQLAPARG